MLEKQFRRFFAVATRSKGVTGRVLIQLLERRLDNVVYRSLLAASRNQARQFVSHGFVFIGGKRVNIASYIVKEGDQLTVKPKGSLGLVLKDNLEAQVKERSVPTWMRLDKAGLKIDIIRLPEKEDLAIAVDEQLIVELYSK